jgi:hypothetical protein
MSQSASAVTALCDSAALLLLASGPAKLRAPEPTVAALRALRIDVLLPLADRAVVRTGGVAEIALACWVLAGGGRVAAAALAAAYLGFAAVAVRLIVVGSAASCGCFGTVSAPVGRAHLAVCLAAAAAAVAATVSPVASARTLFAPDPAIGAAIAVLAVTLAAAAYLCLTALPELLRS